MLSVLVATTNKAGKPNVSAKGSLRVLDHEHLVFADIRSPRTIANIKENPQIGVICINPNTRKGCRIWGKASNGFGRHFQSIEQRVRCRKTKVNHVVKVAVEEAFAF